MADSEEKKKGKVKAVLGGTASFLSSNAKKIRENTLAAILMAILLDVSYGLFNSPIILLLTLIISLPLIGFLGLISLIRFVLPAPWNLIPFYTLAAMISGAKSETSTENAHERKQFFQFSFTSLIILVIIVILVAYNWQNIPSLLTKGQVAGGELAKKGGVGGFFSNLGANIRDWITLQYGFKQPKIEEKQPSGIKIQDFTASRSYFEEGQPVVTRARIHIDALPKDDAVIRFWCESEGNQGKISISRAEGDAISLERNKARDASLLCEIERGLNADNEKPITRKVTLTGEYENFATKTALKIYTLDESSYEEVGTQDPFKYFRIEEPLLSSNNIIKSQCVSGCGLTLLSLKVSAPQPLTQLGRYFLDINLQKDRDWYGEINKINEIKVSGVPESVQLSNCDPAISVEGGQPGNPSAIQSLLTDKKDLTFSCEFAVTNPDLKLGDNVGQFIVEANYNYAVSSTTTVDIKPATQKVQSIPTGKSFVSDLLQGESPFAEVLR